jgi:tRNA pseudouridine synthase 9
MIRFTATRLHGLVILLERLGSFNDANQGTKMGKGGIDLTPSAERRPPTPPPHLRPEEIVASETASPVTTPPVYTNNTYVGKTNIMPPNAVHTEAVSALNSEPTRTLLPRETGEDVGFASPVPLSAEAVTIIMALRNMKDEDEDWGRWRDNIFKGKKPLVPSMNIGSGDMGVRETPTAEGTALEGQHHALKPTQGEDKRDEDSKLYCPECYLPLHPDPSPGVLFIFLHALRYTTSLGSFETEMPWWAQESWHGEGWEKYE